MRCCYFCRYFFGVACRNYLVTLRLFHYRRLGPHSRDSSNANEWTFCSLPHGTTFWGHHITKKTWGKRWRKRNETKSYDCCHLVKSFVLIRPSVTIMTGSFMRNSFLNTTPVVVVINILDLPYQQHPDRYRSLRNRTFQCFLINLSEANRCRNERCTRSNVAE